MTCKGAFLPLSNVPEERLVEIALGAFLAANGISLSFLAKVTHNETNGEKDFLLFSLRACVNFSSSVDM